MLGREIAKACIKVGCQRFDAGGKQSLGGMGIANSRMNNALKGGSQRLDEGR
jgi:hypothetical protein